MNYVSSENLKTFSTKLNTILNTKVSVNPQSLSAAQQSQARTNIGLGQVDNTSDAKKQVYEANLRWGGKNLVNLYGPIDAAMVPELGANRFAYLKPAGVEVEYSRDGGETWVDYGLSDAQKATCFSPSLTYLAIGGKSEVGVNKSSHQLRITITSNLAGLYTVLNKFVVYASSTGTNNCWCTIDKITKADVDAGGTNWINVVNKQRIEGWSGYNVINTENITLYENSSTQYQKLRFTFGGRHETASEMMYGGLRILSLKAFGGVGWAAPSNLAKWGHAYSMDGSQNCTFPAKVTSVGLDAKNNKVTSVATPTESADAANKAYVDIKTTNIAKTSLASDVRTSLGKADTAMQSIADKSITKAKLADAVTTEIASKQNSTDSTLATTSKTIVGAINEVSNNFENGKAKEAKKVSNKLTAGSKTYDGSAAVSLTKADLGLGNVNNTADKDKIVKGAMCDANGKNFTNYINNESYIIYNEAVNCPKPYISRICNGLAAANKWAIISITGTYTGNISSLFDGNYDTPLTIPGNNTCTINIKFNEDGTETYPGYPYGTLYTMWYYGGIPSEISCRVYCTYEPHGIGWHALDKGVNNGNIIGFNNSFYKISQIEFTITGNGLDTITDGKYPTMLAQIEYRLRRPAPTQPHPILYKYKAETLYYPLTVPELIEGGTTISAKYAPKSIEATVNNKVDKVSGKQLSTNDYTTAEKNKLAGLSNTVATISANGLMSSADKVKLDGIETGANKTVVVNDLIPGSTDAIAGGVVADKFSQIETEISGLATTTYVDGAISSVNEMIGDKQDKLVSGTNIKTINGASILGNGNITISGSGGLSPVEVTNGDIDDALPDMNIDSGSIIQFGGKMYHPHYDINTINALKQGMKWPYSAANSTLMASCGESLSDNGDFIGMFINKIHWSIQATRPAIDGIDMLVVWKHPYYDGGVILYIIERVNY